MPVDERPPAARHVLVVDDDRAVRHLIVAALDRHGFEVTVADNGRVGLERVSAAPRRYDIVLMDYNMPEMDGLSASRGIEDVAPQLPVIMMTSNPSIPESGCGNIRSLLRKPFEAHELIDCVDSHLDPAT